MIFKNKKLWVIKVQFRLKQLLIRLKTLLDHYALNVEYILYKKDYIYLIFSLGPDTFVINRTEVFKY
jgi:hypothetical protein